MKKQLLLQLTACMIFLTVSTTSAFAQIWHNVGAAGFSAGSAQYTSLAFSPSGEPHVAFRDNGIGNKATVMKFDGTNWVNVGTAGFSTGQAERTSLAFSPSGEPHVAFRDIGNGSKATVMKFDGTDWVNVGTAGFSAGQAEYTSLAFSPSGEPHVAYRDDAIANGSKASVMKFDGTNWVNVGTAGFSASIAIFTSLAFSTSGEPHVAYTDYVNGDKATVKKFDGTNWVDVGSPGFSISLAHHLSLAFSPGGEPHVAFQDYGNPFKATVMKFDGTSWVNVGTAGFSAGTAQYTSLAFSPAGEPHVAYNEVTVKKFDGTGWVNVGTALFSAGVAEYTSLAFSPTGEPYVAYQDHVNGSKATVMKFSSNVGFDDIAFTNSVSVYPNPTTGTIVFSKEYNSTLTDIMGKVILVNKKTNSLDISNQPSGMFFLLLADDQGRIVQRNKITKE